MPDDTSTIGPPAYRSDLTQAYGARGREIRRASPIDAALELLHAMALIGQLSKANDVAVAVGPIPDAIPKAVDPKAG